MTKEELEKIKQEYFAAAFAAAADAAAFAAAADAADAALKKYQEALKELLNV